MGVAKKPYGPWAQQMLTELRGKGLLKTEALIAWLRQRDLKIDRTLVSHWAAGRSHLPADMLPLLAEFADKPEAVFGPFLRAVGCFTTQLPDGSTEDRELIDLMLEAGATLGKVQHALMEARAPDSPGGVDVTPEERVVVRRQLDELIHHLAGVRARLNDDGRKKR